MVDGRYVKIIVGSQVVGSRTLVSFLVYVKIALAITLEIALITGELVRVMCFCHVKLKVSQVFTIDPTYWTGGSGWG